METIAELLGSVGSTKTVAAVMSMSAAALLSLALAYPEPISSSALGPEWQCTRTAFIWTSCSRARLAESVVHRARPNKVSQRATNRIMRTGASRPISSVF
jgi:hypothetical protein